MAALPNLITVEQFRNLPESGEQSYELHYGEVVAVTRLRSGHIELQYRLALLLTAKLEAFGAVRTEYPYRTFSEFELRVAAVAAVSRDRWAAIDPDDNLHGAPDLVVQILSSLPELAGLCLATGCLQFWVVDPDQQSVTVTLTDGATRLYRPGDSIPLAPFADGALAVAEIFA